ncbi:hypothetical protein D3C72_145230 [compost metagenome]
MNYATFDEVIDKLVKAKRPMHLLMGNGFSVSYDPKIFSYNALHDFIGNMKDPNLAKLFTALKTKNFELVMQQLETSLLLLDLLNADEKIKNELKTLYERLKAGLIDAIRSLHPEHVFKVTDDQCVSCAKFLSLFLASKGDIYTTNYDLLLYWVVMREKALNANDGFGYELQNPVEITKGGEEEWSELMWGPNRSGQNIFYLHGALPLFDAGHAIHKETYGRDAMLLENIQKRIEKKEYPIFVTAGDGNEKLAQIRHNNYLSDCYDNLSEINGSIVTFGFGFGEYDDHIIDALNRAAHVRNKMPPKLWSVYIGVYSKADEAHIESIRHKFHMTVYTYDASTVKIWN